MTTINLTHANVHYNKLISLLKHAESLSIKYELLEFLIDDISNLNILMTMILLVFN